MGEPSVHNILSRLMEEKHTFTYKKLVVPMSMRSPYWKYYGFPATDDGDILTKVKIICVLCKTQLAYNRNTSNLRMHLQNKHPAQLMELVAEHPPEIRPHIKGERSQMGMDSSHEEIPVTPGTSRHIRHTPKAKKARYHRSLENTDSGFVKHGNMYYTPADGSIEIDGDLQFMSDPNITIANLEEDENESDSAIQIVASSNNTDSNVILVANNSENHQAAERKNISDAIAEYIVLDLQQPDVVEGRGFQRLIATLRSPCEIPSRARLVDEILPSMQNQIKENEQAILQEYSGCMGLTMEEWTSNNGETFITMSVHYQHKIEPQLESRVMSTIHCPAGDASLNPTEYWSVTIDGLIAEWHINLRNVTAVVVATECPEILDVLRNKNLTVIPCLIHSLQRCATTVLTLPDIAPVLNKCRSLLGLIHRHATAFASLRMQEPVLQVEELLVTDYPDIWMSSYQMLEQLSARRSLFPSVLENVDELTPEQRLQMLPTDDDWSVIDDLIAVLMPFKVAVLTLSEERYPLLSLLEPLLWQLCSSHLVEKDGDTQFASSLKLTLSAELSSRYSDMEARNLLRTATMLDPRFKTLGYADEGTKKDVCDSLQEALESVIELDPSAQQSDLSSPGKKNRLSGMALLLGGLCESKAGLAVAERAKLELVQFKSEPSAPLDACPLQWWANGAPKCPHLVELARRYLGVPAAAIPAQRIPHLNAVLFSQRRAALSPDQADTLLFLNGNYGA